MKIDNNTSKANLGRIGEFMAVANIMAQEHDAFLANMTINNVASYDLICRNRKNGKVVLVQVKTSWKDNFPVGLKLGNASDDETLNKKIIGPWIFIHVDNKQEETKFSFHILSRKEMIELTKLSNDWYVNHWNRENRVNDNNVVGLRLSWINGEGVEEKPGKYEAFNNPLKLHDSENNWDKLWED